MSDPIPVPPSIGVIIASAVARKIVYSIYAVAAVIVGGAAAYFIGTGHQIPEIVVGSQAVVAYLAIPVGGLAVANTK